MQLRPRDRMRWKRRSLFAAILAFTATAAAAFAAQVKCLGKADRHGGGAPEWSAWMPAALRLRVARRGSSPLGCAFSASPGCGILCAAPFGAAQRRVQPLGGSLAVHAARTPLEESLQDCSKRELINALKWMGFKGPPLKLPKRELVQWMARLPIDPSTLNMAKEKRRKRSERNTVRRERKRPSRGEDALPYSREELKMALKLLGIDLPKGRLSRLAELEELEDLNEILGFSVRGARQGQRGAPRHRAPRGQRPMSAAERLFYGKDRSAFRSDFTDEARDSWRGNRARGQRGSAAWDPRVRAWRRSSGPAAWEEQQRRHQSQFRRGSRTPEIEWDSFDDDYDYDYDYDVDDYAFDWHGVNSKRDDFADFFLEEEEEEDIFGIPGGGGPTAGPRFRTYSTDVGPKPRVKPVSSPEQQTRPTRYDSKQVQVATMERALREHWNAERLSSVQAADLLGVRADASRGELQDAKKQLVSRWHPDKNPDDPHAGAALGLVLAAVQVLRRL